MFRPQFGPIPVQISPKWLCAPNVAVASGSHDHAPPSYFHTSPAVHPLWLNPKTVPFKAIGDWAVYCVPPLSANRA